MIFATRKCGGDENTLRALEAGLIHYFEGISEKFHPDKFLAFSGNSNTVIGYQSGEGWQETDPENAKFLNTLATVGRDI